VRECVRLLLQLREDSDRPLFSELFGHM
jgi:hypothetical protein